MSIECSECERDLRGGHDPSCSRFHRTDGMKLIWKFPIQIKAYQELKLPYGAEILTVQFQEDTLCLWALVPSSNHQSQTRELKIFGTGQFIEFSDSLKYIATVQRSSFVWHVFEVKL